MAAKSTALDRLPDRELWEKMPAESFKAFNAFAVFRDLGYKRTIPKVRDALNLKSVSHLEEWSARFHWFERVEAYDLDYDRRMREQRETDREESTRIERGMALTLERVAIERFRGKGVPGEEDYVKPISPNELSAADATRMLAEGVRLRRLADGMPTDFVKGAFMISSFEAERLFRDLIEIALPLIPEELHERFMVSVQAIGAKG